MDKVVNFYDVSGYDSNSSIKKWPFAVIVNKTGGDIAAKGPHYELVRVAVEYYDGAIRVYVWTPENRWNDPVYEYVLSGEEALKIDARWKEESDKQGEVVF